MKVSGVGAIFDFPEFTEKQVASAYVDCESVKMVFDGDCLPDKMKEKLYKLAKEEISLESGCGVLPDCLVGGKLFFIDIGFSEQTRFPTEVYIGMQLLVNEHWRELITSETVKSIKYFLENLVNGENNLSKMYHCFSSFDVKLTSWDEYKKVIDLLSRTIKL